MRELMSYSSVLGIIVWVEDEFFPGFLPQNLHGSDQANLPAAITVHTYVLRTPYSVLCTEYVTGKQVPIRRGPLDPDPVLDRKRRGGPA